MSTPRLTLAALAVAALGLSIGLAPSAGSAAPEPLKAGTTGAKSYQQLAKKKDYIKLDLLAVNDFHGNLEPPTGSSGNIPGITTTPPVAGPRRAARPTWPACSTTSARSRARPVRSP